MKVWTLAALIVAALALAACGGDSEEEGGGDDYIAQADAACTTSSEKLRDVNLTMGLDFTEEEGVEKGKALLPIRQEAQATLEAIEVPSDAEPEFEEFVTAYGDFVVTTEDQIEALGTGEQAKIEMATAELTKAGDERQATAEAAGLTVCASVLPDDDASAAEDALRAFTTTNDPATSCEYENPEALVTETYVEDGFGGIDKCVDEQKAIADKLPTDIVVSETTGVDDIVASIDFEDVGGKFDGDPANAQLYYDDGGWRLYNIAPVG